MPIDNLQNEVVKAPFSRRIGVAITDLFILLFTFFNLDEIYIIY